MGSWRHLAEEAPLGLARAADGITVVVALRPASLRCGMFSYVH